MNKFENHKTPLKGVSPELMAAYLAGLLSPAMQHAVEKYLLDNPFEAEAMEGFAENNSVLNDVHALEEKLAIRINKSAEKAVIPLWRQFLPYAASFILLLVATVAAVYFYGRMGSEDGISLRDTDFIPLDSVSRQAPTLPIVDSSSLAKVEITQDQEISRPEHKQQVTSAESNAVKIAKKKGIEEVELLLYDTPTLADRSEGESAEVTAEPMAMADLEDTVEEELIKDEDGIAVKTEIAAKKIARSNVASQTMDTATKPEEASGMNITETKNQLIAGQVTDAETGEALPGVNVLIKNTNTGVNTDLNGDFSIEANIGDVLVISSIGMDREEVEITDSNFKEIELSTDVRQLSEVVVTSYEKSEEQVASYQSANPKEGMKAYKQYLEMQLDYPVSAVEKGIEGKVKLKVTIKANGEIGGIEVLKGLSERCDAEAIRLVTEGPKWKAAEKNGKAVESTVKVKIKFKLPEK